MTDLVAAPVVAPASSFRAVRLGFAMGASRLRHASTALVLLLGVALAVSAAWIERQVTSAAAVDRALEGTFGLVVPLVVLALMGRGVGRARLGDACFRVARFGVPRRAVALGAIAATGSLAIAACAVMATASVLVAHAAGAPPLGFDAFTSAWIAALTAAAYTGWFALGATFGRRGGGRFLVLVLDFAIGSTGGLAACALPRGHAEGLLGGAAPLDLAQPASAAALVAIAVATVAAACVRSGD